MTWLAMATPAACNTTNWGGTITTVAFIAFCGLAMWVLFYRRR